jgi:8-oxo-dGTP diphosphatase
MGSIGSCKNKMESRGSPRLAVDIITENQEKKILLVERKNEPFRGYKVIPGGFVEAGERVEDSALRELKEETGINARLISILGVYSDPKRDPRGHVVSTVFVAEYLSGTAKGSDDASDAAWYDIEKIANYKLGFDHEKIISDYIKWKTEGGGRGTFWSSKK